MNPGARRITERGSEVTTPVHGLFLPERHGGATELLLRLLTLELPTAPTNVAVARLRISSERFSDIRRMTRKGRVFSAGEIRELLAEAKVNDGWFFFDAPGAVGEPVEPVDVPLFLGRSAFVVDVLEAWAGSARTVHLSVFRSLREGLPEGQEMDPVKLSQVRLCY